MKIDLVGLRVRLSRWRPDLAPVFLTLWGLFIVYATTLPFDFSASGELVQSRLRRLWEHPLRGGSWPDVWSNVLLFLPWGLLLAVWRAGRGTRYIPTLALTLASGLLISSFVETLQLFSADRFTSFVDLVTNTFGSVVGGTLGWPWARWVWPRAAVWFRQKLVSRPWATCATATGAGFVLAGLAPYDVNLSGGSVAAALAKWRPVPFGPPLTGPSLPAKPCLWGAELLAWTLAGGVLAMAEREALRRGGRAFFEAVGSCVGLCAAIETLQLLIPRRDVDMTSPVLALVGSAIGAAAVLRSAAREAHSLIPYAVAVWGVAVALTLWSPPRFTWPEPPYLQPERVIPFWSYYDSRTLDDLADVVGQVALFAPLGASWLPAGGDFLS